MLGQYQQLLRNSEINGAEKILLFILPMCFDAPAFIWTKKIQVYKSLFIQRTTKFKLTDNQWKGH